MIDKDYDIIKKDIVINASVDKVFSALIDPEQLTQWFPNVATIEPRVGGKIFFRFSKYPFSSAISFGDSLFFLAINFLLVFI